MRKRKRKKGRQENHAKIKKNNNGQIMYSMFAYKLYVHMFLCPRVCNCVVVSVCVYEQKHVRVAHTILYSPFKIFWWLLISNLWFMGDSLC